MEVQRIPKRTVYVIEPPKSILVDKEKYHQKRVAAYQPLRENARKGVRAPLTFLYLAD